MKEIVIKIVFPRNALIIAITMQDLILVFVIMDTI